jgi:tetratricopeptide (TPR) repeat protein
MSAEGYKEKGNEEFKKGNYEKAIEFYTYATEMDPKNHVYYTNRSLCYASMKKWEKSLRDAEKSVSLKSDWEKGHYRKGCALRELGRYQEALSSFEKCSDINPKAQEYKQSFEETKRLMYKGMSESEILKLEGNDFFKRGKIQEAIDRYSAALAKCVGNDEKTLSVKADIYANRAACYVQLYEPKKVKDDCDQALAISPKHPKALLRRGLALESLEKYEAAVKDFEAALQIVPNDSMAVQALERCRKAAKVMRS